MEAPEPPILEHPMILLAVLPVPVCAPPCETKVDARHDPRGPPQEC